MSYEKRTNLFGGPLSDLQILFFGTLTDIIHGVQKIWIMELAVFSLNVV